MAMTEAGLAAAVKAAMIEAAGPAADPATLDKFAQAIGKAVVQYLKASAELNGLVTSGAGSGGTVTGTLK